MLIASFFAKFGQKSPSFAVHRKIEAADRVNNRSAVQRSYEMTMTSSSRLMICVHAHGLPFLPDLGRNYLTQLWCAPNPILPNPRNGPKVSLRPAIYAWAYHLQSES